MRLPKAAGLFQPSGPFKAPGAILVLQLLSLTGVYAGHCRPRQPGSGGSALAPGASGLASGIDAQTHGSSSGGGQAQITITRTITVTSAPSKQTPSGTPGNKGAMVTVFFNGKDKYPSVGPVNPPSPSSGSEYQPGTASDAGTTGSVSILPISSSGWSKPSSPSYGQSGSGQPLPTIHTNPAKAGGGSIGDVAHQSPSGAAWSASGSGSDKVTDRLPGGQGGVVVTPTPSSGAWGPNPTLSTSTPGASLSYNR